jgi:DNA (cytosine-5)-methyltransferase 1
MGDDRAGLRSDCPTDREVAGNDVNVTELVLSLFPGIGLLDRAFSIAGFCIVQAQDKITGGDVREFVGVPGRFDGIVAGPPCQGFSCANSYRKDYDHYSVQHSREMLQQTCRIISECEPEWFLIENVPNVPNVRIEGYTIQRIPITDLECGGSQLRCRHIQFGHIGGKIIRPERVNDCTRNRKKGRPAKAVTTKTDRWKDFTDVCRRQGLETPIDLPGWTRTAKVKAVGNGVPLRIGRALAAAVAQRAGPRESDCLCGCGRQVTGKQLTATAKPWVDVDGYHEP